MAPGFLIIGAQKAGTSSLHAQLVRHPQVLRPAIKEVHYFDLNYAMGPDWYRAFFPHRATAAAVGWRLGARAVTGESSPSYLFHPHAPRRILRDLPGIPLIALLRDPVERAFSHYQHAFRHGWETLSFDEALAAEAERTTPDRERLETDEFWPGARWLQYSYRARGVYLDQLTRWMPVYDPARLLVLRSEDYFADPGRVLRQTLDFLRLAPWDPGHFTVRNQGRYARTHTAAHEALAAFYAPHNRRLEQWLGRPMGWSS